MSYRTIHVSNFNWFDNTWNAGKNTTLLKQLNKCLSITYNNDLIKSDSVYLTTQGNTFDLRVYALAVFVQVNIQIYSNNYVFSIAVFIMIFFCLYKSYIL